MQMELLWRPLVFWDQQQRLICKWLDEDYKVYSKYKYLVSVCKSDSDVLLLAQYKELETEKSEALQKWWDKYNRDLIQIKMDDILDELVKPIIEKKKIYYETYYNSALAEKREVERRKLQKKFKDRNIELSF